MVNLERDTTVEHAKKLRPDTMADFNEFRASSLAKILEDHLHGRVHPQTGVVAPVQASSPTCDSLHPEGRTAESKDELDANQKGVEQKENKEREKTKQQHEKEPQKRH